MAESIRVWWRNCNPGMDDDLLAIDELEDKISPIPPNIVKIRNLISTLELCHHKAERWINNIIEAIGTGQTSKGLGTRSTKAEHPVEYLWQSAGDTLCAWSAGCPADSLKMKIGEIPASRLMSGVGERSPLKEWQVRRIAERIHSFIRRPQTSEDIVQHYLWLQVSGDAYTAGTLQECPEYFKDHADFWQTTVETQIQNKINDKIEPLSLASAIDLLMPCNWNFLENLEILLGAVGGNLTPSEPFFACSFGIKYVPIRERLLVVAGTLHSFCGASIPEQAVDPGILAQLGEPTSEKKWLAASLAKTIQLQLED